MKVDSSTNTNAAALEPDSAAAVQPADDNVQVTQQESTAKPGAALAALSSSASPLTADLGAGVSADQARRIDAAIQNITGNPETMVSLLSTSLDATDNLALLDASAAGAGGVTAGDAISDLLRRSTITNELSALRLHLADLEQAKLPSGTNPAPTPEEIAAIDEQIALIEDDVAALEEELAQLVDDDPNTRVADPLL